MSKPLDSGETS